MFNGHEYGWGLNNANPPDKCFPDFLQVLDNNFCMTRTGHPAGYSITSGAGAVAAAAAAAASGTDPGLVYPIPYKCFKYGDEEKYCFTKSIICGSCGKSKYCTCAPSGDPWKVIAFHRWSQPDRHNDPDTVVYECGTPCLYGDDWL